MLCFVVLSLGSQRRSVTRIHGGDIWNVIPDQVALRGATRRLDMTTRQAQLERLRDRLWGRPRQRIHRLGLGTI